MSALTESEALGAWSVADEMLLHFEASCAAGEPLIMGDFIGLAVKVAADGEAEATRRYAIRLGVLAMRIAMGEKLAIDAGMAEHMEAQAAQ